MRVTRPSEVRSVSVFHGDSLPPEPGTPSDAASHSQPGTPQRRRSAAAAVQRIFEDSSDPVAKPQAPEPCHAAAT